ncbi:DUF418 domain-containing protein [Nocardia yamanashiensis]|uniref:DUF418 domain-containing protein n=1 Tax=Nocardia yamanashiensis TaxID=209247 RepID=UPI00082BC7F1|nr:DUF418 domain-containing protein [Nocardia yamanashiensis]
MTEGKAVESVPRLVELDVLRGFALGGILLVNISVMSGPDFPDGAVLTVLDALFHNKFYVLFSFLFGYSLTLQFRAAQRAGVSGRARTVRRCLALMALGAVHAVFFFIGDVLFSYGVIGLVLLLLSRLRPRAAAWTATGLLGCAAIAMTVFVLLADNDGGAGDSGEHTRELEIMRAGWGEAAAWRWEVFSDSLPLHMLFAMVAVLPLFLFGLAAGKARLLEDPARYLPWLPRVQWIGFGVGGPVSVLNAVFHWPVLAGVGVITAPLLSAAYAATLLRAVHAWPRVAEVFAPAGKIAATTYISQSVITSIIFTGYGFALAGRLDDWAVVAVALGIYAAQLYLARIYVRRHRYGPVEWVLRAATYGPRQFRRTPTTVDS